MQKMADKVQKDKEDQRKREEIKKKTREIENP